MTGQGDERALSAHARYRGKVQVWPKCPIHGREDFALWYTPGVAAASRAIAARPEAVRRYTNKANCIAIVTDGTRVLGLGDIGPEAALPVMEGKALLFKYLGGVDAVPICLATKDAGEIMRTVERLQPAFGGVNLEDIASPKCFDVLDDLRQRLSIPVWHDDQQGTAAVTLAGLLNALQVVGKPLDGVRIALIGMGAANVACYRLLQARGVDPAAIVACDSTGTLHAGRGDIEAQCDAYRDKWRVCRESNPERVRGGVAEALAGADVCIAFSRAGPGVIPAAAVRGMARDAIVFACANPVPEIWPEEALAAGARVVASGRSDFPNQVNNALVFPGLFRGVLDVAARAITEDMALAAADALATYARGGGLREDRILPPMDDADAAVCQAVAVGRAAIAAGLAGRPLPPEALEAGARDAIARARHAMRAMIDGDLFIAVDDDA